MSPAILLLAAGASSRMRGGDKLMETLEGEPLLRRSARTALGSRAAEVVVILGANRPARQTALEGLPVRVVANKNWKDGMGSSIAVGAAALADPAGGVMILPADMPDLTPVLLDRLIAAFEHQGADTILRPRYAAGKPGNPVLFGADYLPALARLTGDAGARSVIADHPGALRHADIDDAAILIDLDTPEAWADYRAARGTVPEI